VWTGKGEEHCCGQHAVAEDMGLNFRRIKEYCFVKKRARARVETSSYSRSKWRLMEVSEWEGIGLLSDVE